MEFLEIVKEPIPKENLLKIKNIDVVKIDPISNENSEKLKEFLDFIWNKKIKKTELKQEKSEIIKKAIKTNIVIKLQQYTKEELKELQSKLIQEQFPVNVEINTNNLDPDDFDEKEKLNKIKKKQKEKRKKKNIDNGIISELLLEHEEIFDKYKYYIDDTSIKFDLTKKYILNNKIAFLNDIKKKMMGLDLLIEDDGEEVNDKSNTKTYKPFIHQLIVRQYLNSFSPYRGLLLYHGLGSGKTCTSIGIIESMKYNKDNIYILTPASLQQNYRTQMKFCGNQLFKENNFWVFVDFPKDSSRVAFIKRIHSLTHLPIDYLRKKEGVFLVDKSKPNESNFYDLPKKDTIVIEEQIDLMIKHKFKYISYNGITQKIWKSKYSKNDTINPFHNSTIIIDEGHNFVSRIINKINAKKSSVSTMMYEAIMSAENCNVVVLSGTPLINYPCELGVLFNLISGYNFSHEFKLQHSNSKFISQKKFNQMFSEQNKNIDLIDYFPNTNTLRITQNPYGFVTNSDGTVTYDDNIGKITMQEFKNNLITILKDNKYKILEIKTIAYKRFPDNDQEFNKYFVGKNNNFIKKPYFQSKIVGLVSYLGDKRSLMPDVIVPDDYDEIKEEIFIEKIEMNDYVLRKYSEERKKELEMDKNIKKTAQIKKKGPNNKENFSSSYRIFSRSACNFVFPEDIEKPMPHKNLTKMTEDELENLSSQEMITHNDGLYDELDIREKFKGTGDEELTSAENIPQDKSHSYSQKIENALIHFEKNAPNYFESSIPKHVEVMPEEIRSLINEENKNNLLKYAPKIHKILENLMDEENIGIHLLYSNFRQLGGIGILIKVLDYYGFTRLKIKKNATQSNEWELDLEHPYYYTNNFKPNRKFYALYTGKESNEEKEIIRNILNSDFNKIKSSILREQIIQHFGNIRSNIENGDAAQQYMNNHYGKIIKLLIISASGAEGIDLKNVRYVHIMEPYWHPVRINQVVGRARRINSHKDLPEELRNVKIFMYLLSYNKLMMKAREDSYIHLKKNDVDEKGELVTTDERLYQIMLRKKQLMEEFLTGIKEASIDCLVNYEDKSKCLHFPSKNNAIRKTISDINYKNDKYNVFTSSTKMKPSKNENEENESNVENEEEISNKKKLVRMQLLSKEDKTKFKLYAVNISNEPNIVYDFDAYINYGQLMKIGIVKTNTEGELYVE